MRQHIVARTGAIYTFFKLNKAVANKTKCRPFIFFGDRQFYIFMEARPSPSGGAVVPGPPFEIGAPHFTFGPPVAAYIQYCFLNMLPPPSGFWPPLLLNLGDGPDGS